MQIFLGNPQKISIKADLNGWLRTAAQCCHGKAGMEWPLPLHCYFQYRNTEL